MNTCTFFGHKDTPKEIEPILVSTLIDLIENKNVGFFYVGNHGNFDFLVRKNLKLLKIDFPHIDYAVVLSYIPLLKNMLPEEDYSDTIFFDGLENVPPKFAINKRNMWMLNKSDYVVTYVERIVGGAAQFKAHAQKKGKIVIELSDIKV
ncbi:MAG: hypothetical protein IKB45_04745 [Clostridia bacterium]|nr:hypothetical protein [Clostridia bacterium]